jgi:hypothetical protein
MVPAGYQLQIAGWKCDTLKMGQITVWDCTRLQIGPTSRIGMVIDLIYEQFRRRKAIPWITVI